MLARAFVEDPLLRFVFPELSTRVALAPAFFSPAVRLTNAIGEVDRLDGLVGVALWRPPGQLHESEKERSQAGFDELPNVIGESALARFSLAYDTLARRHSETIAAEHWFLELIAVEPGKQGAGRGGQLLRSGLERADDARMSCYLETLNSRNVPFYEDHGFRVVVDEDEPVSGLRFWGLLRPPMT